MRLLLVEDHAELSIWVAKTLRQSGFVIDVVERGEHALTALLTQPYDLVILDLSLPGMDGLDVLRHLRAQEKTARVPVLILTARATLDDKVKGLNLGADDYLAKPFEVAELEARIKSLLRRSGNVMPTVRVGQLEFDTTNRIASVGGRPLSLTPRELSVLEVLVTRLGKPVPRNVLFEKIFSFDDEARIEAIEIYVHRLRKKLEGSGAFVSTLRGLGYVLSDTGNDG
ncbi:response regulator [Propionivibrio sp.]|jgi:two-component system response regulator TctD|uniref:response regulator n=1 Tax=Propionivibrio sp. TaxID=2212460 RepID=UPI00272EA566|nr:response regulator [Propionivibrio sp.]